MIASGMRPEARVRISFLLGIAGLVSAGGRAGLGREAHVELVQTYCLSCHDDDHKKGGLALDAILNAGVSEHPDVWENVVRKLRARQMPPIGKERPEDAMYDAVVAGLEASLDRAAAAHPNPGRTGSLRRLTRTEYQNAIRDLLAVDVDASSLLPGDES